MMNFSFAIGQLVLLIYSVFRLSSCTYPDVDVVQLVSFGEIDEQLKLIDKDLLVYNLQFLQHTPINTIRKRKIFSYIRGNRRVDEIGLDVMNKLGTFLQGITSDVLRKYFDCTNADYIRFFGMANLKLRYLGILAECLEEQFGNEVFTNYESINRITGILCGFGVEKLKQIKQDHFLLITQEVFTHLDQCTKHQLKALYKIATSPNVYGSPHSWDRTVVTTIGILFTVASVEEIRQIEQGAFKGLSPNTMKQLESEKRKLLTQINHSFDLRTRREFWSIVGLSYKLGGDILIAKFQ